MENEGYRQPSQVVHPFESPADAVWWLVATNILFAYKTPIEVAATGWAKVMLALELLDHISDQKYPGGKEASRLVIRSIVAESTFVPVWRASAKGKQ